MCKNLKTTINKLTYLPLNVVTPPPILPHPFYRPLNSKLHHYDTNKEENKKQCRKSAHKT